MKAVAVIVSGILCASGTLALAQDTASDRNTGADRSRVANATGRDARSSIDAEEFAKKAGAAGMAEVEMGKLGAQKATNADVKAYAQRMVADHTKANKELMTVAKAKGLEVPTEPDLMHKGMMKKFDMQKADKDFDHDFMQQMVRDHEAVVELFQTAANDAKLDPELKALAKKTLPVLQDHLKDANALEAKLGK